MMLLIKNEIRNMKSYMRFSFGIGLSIGSFRAPLRQICKYKLFSELKPPSYYIGLQCDINPEYISKLESWFIVFQFNIYIYILSSAKHSTECISNTTRT